MDLNSHLNPRFALWTTIAWTAGCAVGIFFNGGLGPIRNPVSLLIATVLCAAVLFFSFGAILSPRMRSIVLKPGTDISIVRKELWLLTFVGAALFIGCLGSLVS